MFFLLINYWNWLIVVSPAAVEPTTFVACNQLRQTRGTSHDADNKTTKLVVRKEAAKPEAAKSDAAEPKASKPKAVEAKAFKPEATERCHGEFDKKAGVEWVRRYKASHHIKLARTTGGA